MSFMHMLVASVAVALPLSAVAAADAAPAAADADAAADAAIRQAVAAEWRSEADRARDQYRHPVETLQFFGLQPSMTVVEVAPGRGWYTSILAPILKDKGRLIVAVNNPRASEKAQQSWDDFAAWTSEHAEKLGNVTLVPFGKGVTQPLAAPDSVDLILTFRNFHDWLGADFAPQALGAFFAALKPGGVLGIVDHRLPEDRVEKQDGHSSYVKESAVIAAVEKAGFRLAAKSEINANPKDTADWPRDVFTLPPTLALGDVDRAKYLAIGESDRMTLKFVKP